MKLILSVLTLTFLLNTPAYAKFLKCENKEFYDGSFMWAKVSLSASIDKTDNEYNLSQLKFEYILSMYENFEFSWAEGSNYDPNYTITNYARYNPRRYFGHIKFMDIYPRKISGQVDLIIPEDKINSDGPTTTFTAYAIMTAMDDHWGGTVDLNCTLSTSDQL